ncbi:carboxypeptidase-like regulatory domain-containing protein [Alistipes sp. ZOR0009]|uniref:carboxypeptidase-like regulatory domain-containing protein n=1 Tax=Alistipes sp. ZOR0009 TaxID=1339253 RepID=UPI000646BE91|nr:carboxypeptidase-like regulatory domain-containing protein [Alistipes sp. ZOR0009]
MTTKQIRKFVMYIGMAKFLNRNNEITDPLPNFKIYFPKLLNNNGKIQSIYGEQQHEVAKGGVSRKSLRNQLVTAGYDIANKLYSYATLTGDSVLTREIHMGITTINRQSGPKLINTSRFIHKKATEHIANLDAYNISTADLDSLKELTDQFMEIIPSYREKQITSKAITSQLATLFAENDSILEMIDRMVEIVRLTKPEFYNSYHDNRKVIYSYSTLSLTGRITCAASGEALKGAKITFVPCGEDGNPLAKASKPLVKKSATKGIFKVKHMPEGTYIVIIEKPGYVTIKQTIVITNGETTVFEVALTQSQTLA